MVTSVMRVGETAAITLDELLLELSGLKIGDAVRVQWSEDGTLVVTPLGRPATKQELAASIRRVSSSRRPSRPPDTASARRYGSCTTRSRRPIPGIPGIAGIPAFPKRPVACSGDRGCRMRVGRITERPWSRPMHTYAQARPSHERLAAGLGWFSLALGTAELAAPRAMARLIGIPDDPRLVNVVRAFGAREIASGLGLLAQPDHAGVGMVTRRRRRRRPRVPRIGRQRGLGQPPAGGACRRGRRRASPPSISSARAACRRSAPSAAPPAGTSRTRSASSGRSPSRGRSRRCSPSGRATRTCRDSCVT